jgi:RNA-directed DNA polymerase
MQTFHIAYADITSVEYLFQAWNEFKVGKRKKIEVQIFERNLEDNIFSLRNRLQAKTYSHGSYQSFYVNDPKRRHIHKASVSDRVVHHLLYTYLYEIYDKTFIFDSYSCRVGKGTHKGVERLAYFTRKVSRNFTKDCFALKCDIKKFFASIDQEILQDLLARKVTDPDIGWILSEVIASFQMETHGKGIPLGNLTSQVFANIYMNELDQYIPLVHEFATF